MRPRQQSKAQMRNQDSIKLDCDVTFEVLDSKVETVKKP